MTRRGDQSTHSRGPCGLVMSHGHNNMYARHVPSSMEMAAGHRHTAEICEHDTKPLRGTATPPAGHDMFSGAKPHRKDRQLHGPRHTPTWS